MFQDVLLKSRRAPVAFVLGYVAEGLLLATLVLSPLLRTSTLPNLMIGFLEEPPPPPAAARRATPARTAPQVTLRDLLAAPVVIPKTIPQLAEEPEAAEADIMGGVFRGVPDGVPGGSEAWHPSSLPPAPPSPRVSHITKLRVGGQVETARLIFQVRPEYPALAKQARIQGTVRLEAVIGPDGTIQDLKALGGHPLLVKAALDAVSHWRYQPTLLDGEAVEVVTDIEVNFSLAE